MIDSDDTVEGALIEGVLTSEAGVMIVKSTSLSTEGLALGRRPEVSKDVSCTSGTATDLIDGEARSTDDS